MKVKTIYGVFKLERRNTKFVTVVRILRPVIHGYKNLKKNDFVIIHHKKMPGQVCLNENWYVPLVTYDVKGNIMKIRKLHENK